MISLLSHPRIRISKQLRSSLFDTVAGEAVRIFETIVLFKQVHQ